MMGFYSIRKLMEEKKLSDSISDSSLPVVAFPSTGKLVTLMNWHRANELYFFDQPRIVRVGLQRIANVFIHSLTFLPVHTETGFLDGVMVNSDRTKKQGLWQVAIDDVIATFSVVASDDPTRSTMIFSEADGDYKVSLS